MGGMGECVGRVGPTGRHGTVGVEHGAAQLRVCAGAAWPCGIAEDEECRG